MSDTVSLLEKIISKFQRKPETFDFLLDRNHEITNMISDIYHKYMNLPKFSDLVKEDTRKYKSFYCDSHSSSVSGFIKILRKYKFYQLDFDDDWNIYIPNGYNRIEIDLDKLTPHNENQIIFGVQGCDDLVGKTCLWNILEKTYGRFGASQLLPETFVLSNDDHVQLFKEQYKQNEIYILKSKRQRKEGLKLTRELKDILESKENYTLVQNYKRDLLLINNRKLNLRIYLLLTIKNGVVEAYINKYATCIYSNKEYDDSTLDFENNITSFNLDLKVYDENPMTMKQLRTYLLDNGYDNPDVLFERINNKVAMVIDAVKPSLGRKGNLNNNLCAQVFGMDFVVDKDLNPFMLEANKGPDMQPKQEYKSVNKLIDDLEDFYESESLVDKCYPVGYKSGNGLKVQRDIFDLLGLIDMEKKNNGFYLVYSG